MKQIPLILDYCTINFPESTFDVYSANKAIIQEINIFKAVNNKQDCNVFISDHGVTLLTDNGNRVTDKKQSLRFSGVGCKEFIAIIPELMRNYDHSISRVDLAFDVYFSISEWRSFITRIFAESMNQQRQRKCYNLQTGEKRDACTIYIGNRRGRYYFRIYNKTLQLNKLPENDNYLIRFEIEIKYQNIKRNGIREIFNPEPYIEKYFSLNAWHDLSDEVKSLWDSFGEDFLLPNDWSNIEFVAPDNIKIMLSSELNIGKISTQQIVDEIKLNESTANYLANKFGWNIVNVILDPILLKHIEYDYFYKTGIQINLSVDAIVTTEYSYSDTFEDIPDIWIQDYFSDQNGNAV